MLDVKEIADKANIIVNGYAFEKDDATIRVLNLNRPGKAIVLTLDGDTLETSMDDIEIQIVKEYYAKNKRFMEEDNA